MTNTPAQQLRSPTPAPSWMSAHLFHRGNLDHLITGTVAPLIEALNDSRTLTGFFFLRYWEGGPHLRLRLLPTDTAHAEHARRILIDHASRYFADHPSPVRPVTSTAEAYRTWAQQLARAERLGVYDQQLHPDDTVEFIAYQPEYAAYGQPPALTAVETHFTESSTIALRLLTTGMPPARRRAAVLAVLMLTLAVCEPDLARATGRLRSTVASRTRPETAKDPAIRSFQQTYSQLRQALHDQASTLWARANGTCQPLLTGQLAAWQESVRTLHQRLHTAQAQGRFAPTDCLSPLAHLAPIASPPTLTVAQVLLRCTHLLANRLGIHATTEAQIAYLTLRTLTELGEKR